MERLKYFNQNFNNGTVDIIVNETVVTCDMFQDEDGDFFLVYLGEIHFLKDCQRR